jgi:hypothetical protein
VTTDRDPNLRTIARSDATTTSGTSKPVADLPAESNFRAQSHVIE